jgi:hypothetical protein
MMEQMKLSELKTGMHVVLRNGHEGIVFRNGNFEDNIVMIDSGLHSKLSDHEENMRSVYNWTHECDIVRVYDIDPKYTLHMFDYVDNKDYEGVTLIYAEETMTRKEAEEKFGVRIVD